MARGGQDIRIHAGGPRLEADVATEGSEEDRQQQHQQQEEEEEDLHLGDEEEPCEGTASSGQAHRTA